MLCYARASRRFGRVGRRLECSPSAIERRAKVGSEWDRRENAPRLTTPLLPADRRPSTHTTAGRASSRACTGPLPVYADTSARSGHPIQPRAALLASALGATKFAVARPAKLVATLTLHRAAARHRAAHAAGSAQKQPRGRCARRAVVSAPPRVWTVRFERVATSACSAEFVGRGRGRPARQLA